MAVKRIEAEPSTLVVELDHAALIIIDMQRDFLEPAASARRSATTCRCCRRRSRRCARCSTPRARPECW